MVDYTKLTFPDLKVLLREKGLRVSGKKQDLVNRLLESDGVTKTTLYHGDVSYNWIDMTGAPLQGNTIAIKEQTGGCSVNFIKM